MTTLIYYSKGYIYFNIGELVFRSNDCYNLKPSHDICFEWRIFKLEPEMQPRLEIIRLAKDLRHPENCVLDVDATFNLLKYRVLHESLIKNAKLA